VDHNEQVDLDITTSNDVLGEGGGSTGCATGSSSVAQKSSASADLNAIWNELMSMKEVVENEHDRKLRRIESDLRWTMTLVGAQFITIIGSAIAMLAGG
jgi:hypothetical protein